MQDDRTRTCGVALVVAHPGHELRVHRWLETTQPKVSVLTDGSGSDSQSRLDSTRAVLAAAGASVGPVFGPWTDQRAYELIFHRHLDEIRAVVLALAEQFVADDVGVVASDAIEGFNPSHDLCSVVAQCAIRLALSRTGRPITHLDFLLEAAPDADPSEVPVAAGDIVRLQLDHDAWQRKLMRAAEYRELRSEVERNMATHAPSAFRVEVLRTVDPSRDLGALFGGVAPTYERVGEERVAQGVYDRVLRFDEHWLPCAEALRSWTAEAA